MLLDDPDWPIAPAPRVRLGHGRPPATNGSPVRAGRTAGPTGGPAGSTIARWMHAAAAGHSRHLELDPPVTDLGTVAFAGKAPGRRDARALGGARSACPVAGCVAVKPIAGAGTSALWRVHEHASPPQPSRAGRRQLEGWAAASNAPNGGMCCCGWLPAEVVRPRRSWRSGGAGHRPTKGAPGGAAARLAGHG